MVAREWLSVEQCHVHLGKNGKVPRNFKVVASERLPRVKRLERKLQRLRIRISYTSLSLKHVPCDSKPGRRSFPLVQRADFLSELRRSFCVPSVRIEQFLWNDGLRDRRGDLHVFFLPIRCDVPTRATLSSTVRRLRSGCIPRSCCGRRRTRSSRCSRSRPPNVIHRELPVLCALHSDLHQHRPHRFRGEFPGQLRAFPGRAKPGTFPLRLHRCHYFLRRLPV